MDFNLDEIFESTGIDVLEYFEVFGLDEDWQNFYKKLSKYQGKSFSNNQRLVFIYTDTEYILDGIRFTTHNLQSLIRCLGIPNYFCILIGQTDINGYLEKLRTTLTNDAFPISNITFQAHLLRFPPAKIKVDLNKNSLERPYSFLNSQLRSHRCFMMSWLAEHDLLNKGFVSFKNEIKMYQSNENLKLDSFNDINFTWISPLPFTRINEKWVCNDVNLTQIFSTIPPTFKNFSEESDTKIHNTNTHLAQRAFLHVSSETVYNYPEPFLSEKSFKSFAAMRPMIIFGARGSLSSLKSLGFRTWSDYWDESYDDISDPTDRFKAVAHLIEHISNMSLDDCKKMLSDMESILIHNRDLYIDRFPHDQTNLIKTQLLTILNR